MLKNVIPDYLYTKIQESLTINRVNEIRLRLDKPISILSGGQTYFLNDNGISLSKEKALKASKRMIDDIIFKASEYSIYSVNEEIKQGFLVLSTGERIGIAGNYVMENNLVKTIADFTSLNIRVPHQIKNCSLSIFDKLVMDGDFLNTLIVSAPGQGKTTFLRDIILQLSNKNFMIDVLVIDERGEIAGKNNTFDLGDFADILSFCNKEKGFMHGIRAMNPKLIVTDELGDEGDFKAVLNASNCGVKILASIHAKDISELKTKSNFKIIENVFKRYVVLSNKSKPGVVEGVYNHHFNKI